MILKEDSMTVLCKGTYPLLIAIIIVVAAAVYPSNQTQVIDQNQMFYRFPADRLFMCPKRALVLGY